jgi:hypothetical protein
MIPYAQREVTPGFAGVSNQQDSNSDRCTSLPLISRSQARSTWNRSVSTIVKVWTLSGACSCRGFDAFPKSSEIRVARSRIHSLPPCTPLCNPAGRWSLSPSRREGTHLPRQFPGSIKSRNFRFPSRRGAPRVVSLPVGRHYPDASRRLIVYGNRERERERARGRGRERCIKSMSAALRAGSRARTYTRAHRRRAIALHPHARAAEEPRDEKRPRRGRPCE